MFCTSVYFTQACRGYAGSTQCTWIWMLLVAKCSVLFCRTRCQTTANMNILLRLPAIPPYIQIPCTLLLRKSCYQLLSDHKCSKNKINCWCTWRGANRLKANRRDQMFVSKHTTLWLGLFLLLCPDSFFILFKQLDGKENWLKPNWCFMASSSAEKIAV